MTRSVTRALAALATGILATALAGSALASEGGGHGGGTPHINWWTFTPGPHEGAALGWLLVDFAIFVTLVVVFARKPLTEFLESRSLKIRRALDEAKQAKEQAEARAAELEKRLKDLDKEIGTLRDDIKQMGERERTQLEADGKKAAERVAQDTQSQVQSELDRARGILKAEAVALAMELAEQKLRGQLGAADYRRLNTEFVQGFGGEQGKEVRP
ncbi:MAG: ATP synthase F0 subunit B [Pseudomonadota bacterium]